MPTESESPLDQLWKEYSLVFREFDDLTLARWLAQTLGQLNGKAWRLSHPLLGAYRLAAQIGHERQIWFKRLATPPSAYAESPCCRAPKLPLLTRDVKETGLLCQHCNETLVPFDEIPNEVQPLIEAWARDYTPIHQVAHWDDRQQCRLLGQMRTGARPWARATMSARVNESRWSRIISPTSDHTASSAH